MLIMLVCVLGRAADAPDATAGGGLLMLLTLRPSYGRVVCVLRRAADAPDATA